MSHARPRARGLSTADVLYLSMLILGFAVFVTPEFDPDFWWTAAIGLTILAGHAVPQHLSFAFTALHHPFYSQEWGSELIDALLFKYLGMFAVIFMFAVVTWIGFFLAVRRVDLPGRSRWLPALGAALVITSGLQIWGPSPQMYSFGLLAVLLTLLDAYRRSPRRRLLIWIVPLFVVWGNLHGGFTIGLGVMMVYLVGEGLDRILGDARALTWRDLSEMALALAVSVLAPMLNPNGVGVYLYPIKLLSNHLATSSLNEWAPPDFHHAATIPTLVLLVTTVVAASFARQTSWANRLLAGAGMVLMLYAVRDIPVFAILALPLWADGWEGLVAHLRAHRQSREPRRIASAPPWFVGAVLLLVVAVGLVHIASQLESGDNSVQGSSYAVAVGNAVCHGPVARVFAPYGSSGWLIYRLDHREPLGRDCANSRVFIFGEVVLIGPRVFGAYLKIAAGTADALEMLHRYRVSLVWQTRQTALAQLLRQSPRWRCVFADSHSVLYATAATASSWHDSRASCPA